MNKYSISKTKIIFGKYNIENVVISSDGDNIIIETPEKYDISKGIKLK